MAVLALGASALTPGLACTRTVENPNLASSGRILRPGQRPRVHIPRYSWEFQNHSDVRIHGVGMVADTHESAGAGELPPSRVGGKSESPGLDPIPARATVHWRTPDERDHQQEVEIAKQIADPKSFGGTIYFLYEPDGKWRVVTVSDDEAIRRMKAGLQPWQNSGGPT